MTRLVHDVLTALANEHHTSTGTLATAALYAVRVEDVNLLASAALQPHMDPALLTDLARHRTVAVRDAALRNPATPVEAVAEALRVERSATVLEHALAQRRPAVVEAAARRLPALPEKTWRALIDDAFNNEAAAGALDVLLPLAGQCAAINGYQIARLVRAAEWSWARFQDAATAAQLLPRTVAGAAENLLGAWGADEDEELATLIVTTVLDPLATTADRSPADQYVEKDWALQATRLLSGRVAQGEGNALAALVTARVRARAHLPGQEPNIWDRLRRQCGLPPQGTPVAPQPLPQVSLTDALAAPEDAAVRGLAALAALVTLVEAGLPIAAYGPLTARAADDGVALEALRSHADTLPDLAVTAVVAWRGHELYTQLGPGTQHRIAVTLLQRREELPENLRMDVSDVEGRLTGDDIAATTLATLLRPLTRTNKMRRHLDTLLAPVLASEAGREMFLAIADTFTGTVGELVTTITTATDGAAARA